MQQPGREQSTAAARATPTLLVPVSARYRSAAPDDARAHGKPACHLTAHVASAPGRGGGEAGRHARSRRLCWPRRWSSYRESGRNESHDPLRADRLIDAVRPGPFTPRTMTQAIPCRRQACAWYPGRAEGPVQQAPEHAGQAGGQEIRCDMTIQEMKRGPERRIWLLVCHRKPLRGPSNGFDNPTRTTAYSPSATNRRIAAEPDASRGSSAIRSRVTALR